LYLDVHRLGRGDAGAVLGASFAGGELALESGT
jgi:hypothetical protein